jgi:hypothetical protein
MAHLNKKYGNFYLEPPELKGVNSKTTIWVEEEDFYCSNVGKPKSSKFSQRVPDYPVRLENLYEDYSKIPFIVESEYYKSGELKKATTQKVNVSNEDENLWKEFYTQETADMVYYRMPRYFDLFGYDKNSWKK